MAGQVPDKEQALVTTGRLDENLSGVNSVHVMIEWPEGSELYSGTVLDTIEDVHMAMEGVSALAMY